MIAPLSFAFLVDSVDFTRDTVAGLTSLGGSESACLGSARALKARGHDVHVFTTKLAEDAAGVDPWGVQWHHADEFAVSNQWIEWDVVVALRMFHWFTQRVHARLRLLWNQDLLMPGVGAQVMSVAWQLDKMVYVSDYHRRQWEDAQQDFAPIGWVTKNGYDPAHVPTDVVKDPNRIIHISRPERGLAPILAMWPEVRRQKPDAVLQICRYSSMYDAAGWGRVCASFDAEVERVNAEVGGITYLGELNKAQLYRAIAEAAVMWYPGVDGFAETSCIAAVESQACGTPFVGSWKGALPETVPNGVLVRGDAMTPAYQAESIAALLAMLNGCATNGFAYRKAVLAGKQHVAGYTYDVIAGEWEAQIHQWFSERYQANRPAILNQLLQEDDHCAARVVCDSLKFDSVGDAVVAAQTAADFCDRVIAGKEQGAEDYAAHAIQDPLAEMRVSPRFRAVWPKFEGCANVLDVACGNGSFAIGLALAFPAIHVHGFDYAQGNIEIARTAAERAGVADRVTFERRTIYDFDTQDLHTDWHEWASSSARDFDGLFVGEFVEHVANCQALIDALEAPLQDDALVVYTCPSGPFGELVRRGMPLQRGHVHCFKSDDIKAVFGPKRQPTSDFLPVGLTPRGNPVGHWIISYRVEAGRAAGTRDLMTRAMRTRPMPKLSVGLITKNAELDLARCLDSVWAIADEIVVGDTGSSDSTNAIAQAFGARVIDVVPVDQRPDGFAGARNDVLAACTGDWFLWIDADEQLVNAHMVRGYLDTQIFNGFVVHQKHLYQDAAPTFDIPVRLFRTGKDIKFYGCVHEQPQQGDANRDIYPTLEPVDLEVLHTGYLTEDIREHKRTSRNLPLIGADQIAYPERELGKVILLRELVLQSDARRAAAGGQMTNAAADGYEQAIALFTARFDDPAHKFHALARPFYESALKALGIGFEVEMALGGKPTQQGGLGSKHAKAQRIVVRDGAELERVMAHQALRVATQMHPDMRVKTNPDLSVVDDTTREAVTV